MVYPLHLSLFTFHGLLHVRDQSRNILVVRRTDYGCLTQVTLPLGGFGREDVTGKGMTSYDFAGAGFLEPLCGSPVGLDLGHSAFLQLT
jgi:hypothetical protein